MSISRCVLWNAGSSDDDFVDITKSKKRKSPQTFEPEHSDDDFVVTTRKLKRCRKAYICSTCGREYSDGGNLARHVLRSHQHESVNLKRHTCSVCSKTYANIFNLRNHVRLKHRDVDVDLIYPGKSRRIEDAVDDVHPCTECHKKFLTEATLKEHVRQKHPNSIQLPHKSYAATMKCPGLFCL